MHHTIPAQSWLDQIELLRIDANRRLANQQRLSFGQYFTPLSVARRMAAMLRCDMPDVVLLDAGAGIGSLFGAAVEVLCSQPEPPRALHVVAYEVDPLLLPYLQQTVAACQSACQRVNIAFSSQIIVQDFIAHAVEHLTLPLFATRQPAYTTALLNPPYRKIRTDSTTRKLLRSVGIETSNIYTGFLALAMLLLAPAGELVAITPRSFCNGPYFRPFRRLLLNTMALRQFHLFESREDLFRDAAVLQENIILAAQKGTILPDHILVTSSLDADDDMPVVRTVPYQQLVQADDPNQVIHLAADTLEQQVAAQMAHLPATLESLGLKVSTGRVVDFRATPFLRAQPAADTAPLIYPVHLANGTVDWPKPDQKKPNGLVLCQETRDLCVPNEHYVLVKRFTTKEERRRVVAAVYNAHQMACSLVGFENHLNYIHRDGHGLDLRLAKGLALFLNSTLVDSYVRQFNGQTQVNAADLRRLRYPTLTHLLALGTLVGEHLPPQATIDRYVAQELGMTDDQTGNDPIMAKQRIAEARAVLRDLQLPRAQQNERSALTLLALLNLTPDMPWSAAQNPLCGITPMMEFFAHHYGKKYQPNTRETVRRQTVHQFLEAGLIVVNPDQPERPINSPHVVYQIEQSALHLLRTYDSEQWEQYLKSYLASVTTLKQQYHQARATHRIPVSLPSGDVISLSPGGQNVLVEQIIHEFAARFMPGGEVLYIGDTDTKWAFFAEERLQSLGITVELHGKMPDVIIYDGTRNWLVLIEAVTSHGPIDPKRRAELAALFQQGTPYVVYVTAFLSRQALKEYLADISWETEVWVADAPDHLIHFDGEKFLGPYPGR